jgi:hypothetical protein
MGGPSVNASCGCCVRLTRWILYIYISTSCERQFGFVYVVSYGLGLRLGEVVLSDCYDCTVLGYRVSQVSQVS